MKNAGLYIHIPFCKKKCNYCDFFSVRQDSFSAILLGKNGSKFAKQLLLDINFMKKKYQISRWDTVFVGGGTPSLLSCEDINFIFSSIIKSQKTPPIEFTVEINPEDLTEEKLETIYNSGANRISLGIQSFSDDVLLTASRRGSSEQNIQALEMIKKFNTGTLSCDLISGLKGQTKNILKEDINTLFEFMPEHISLYALCSHKKLTDEEDDNISNLWLFGKNILEKNNYELYEVSNFSYQGQYQSKHNKKYWKLQDYIGVGPGACGCIFFDQMPDCDANAVRFFANKNIYKWLNTQDRELIYTYENILQKEFIEEQIMMELRLTSGIYLQKFKQRFGQELPKLIKNTIEKWQNLNFLELSQHTLKLRKKGKLFLDNFLQDAFKELEDTRKN